MSNPVLGTVVCSGCGGQATVKQTKRRGQYLYSQCVECGIDQRTGKAVQNNLWHSMEWKPDTDKMSHRPANITDDFNQAAESETVLVDDWVDDWQPEELEEETVKPVKSSGSGRALLAVSFLIVGLTTMLRVLR